MTYIGIDISKDSFVAAFPIVSGYQTHTYPNTAKGIRKFIGSLSVTEHHCVMEATGNYGFLLLYLLERQGIAASMVNPKQIKHFSRMMLTVTKTDTKDACMIAMYGEKMNPPVYKMPSETIMLLKQKKTIIRQLKKQLIATRNLKSSLDVLPFHDKNGMKALNKTISFLASQVEALESELADLASSEFDKQVKLLTRHHAGNGIDCRNGRVFLFRQRQAGFTLYRDMPYLPAIRDFCPHERRNKPQWRC